MTQSKKDNREVVFFREGISYLWGIAKNYNVLGGYAYYNSIPYRFCQSPKFTKFTNVCQVFCAFFTYSGANLSFLTLKAIRRKAPAR